MTTHIQTSQHLDIMSSHPDMVAAMMKLEPMQFVDLLLFAPESARLLWTTSVRQWLYGRKEELKEALYAMHPLDPPPSAVRRAELAIILGSIARRRDDVDLAEQWVLGAQDVIQNLSPTEEEQVPYLLRNIAKERAMIAAIQGNFPLAARCWFEVMTLCEDPALQLERARARRQGSIFFLYGILMRTSVQDFLDAAYDQFLDALVLLTKLDPSPETSIQTHIDILRMDWFLGLINTDAAAWLKEIHDHMVADEAIRNAFDWSWRILSAVSAAQEGSEHEPETFELAFEVAENPKASLDYRMEATYACALLFEQQGEHEYALKFCRKIIREVRYTGPARMLAQEMIDDFISNIDP